MDDEQILLACRKRLSTQGGPMTDEEVVAEARRRIALETPVMEPPKTDEARILEKMDELRE